MTTQLFEKFYSGEFLVREGNGTISRTTVTWDNTAGATDLVVQAGTVYSLGTLGTVTVAAKAGNTGNGTVGAVSANPVPVQIGTYLVTMTGATTFGVTAPDGSVLSAGSSAAPYLDGIGFKYTAGGTPNAAGDTFSIAVAIGAAPVVTAGGANVGNGTLSGLEVVQNAIAMTGNYTVAFTSAGATAAFSVAAPDGRRLADGAVGTPYEDEIGFLITTGGTNFAVGDGFTIGVGTGAGLANYYTGAQPPAGIIYNTNLVPAGGTLKLTAIYHHAEVVASALQWLSSVTAPAQATAIAVLASVNKVFAR
jgi:hypothetical protein